MLACANGSSHYECPGSQGSGWSVCVNLLENEQRQLRCMCVWVCVGTEHGQFPTRQSTTEKNGNQGQFVASDHRSHNIVFFAPLHPPPHTHTLYKHPGKTWDIQDIFTCMLLRTLKLSTGNISELCNFCCCFFLFVCCAQLSFTTAQNFAWVTSNILGLSTACKPGYHGNKCQFGCSSLSPGCAQCTQNGQTCTRCKAGFASPSCTGNRQRLTFFFLSFLC